MPWIVDGNNVARGGDRGRVRGAALAVARVERVRLVVVFDGAPPAGTEPVERLGAVEVRYVPHADTAILAALAGSGAGWVLATDDRALAVAARQCGARVVSAAEFRSKADRAAAAGPPPGQGGAPLSSELAWFRDPANRLDGDSGGDARRVRRRKGK
jgi:hypothetical protein